MALLYIGCSTCQAANNPKLPEVLKELSIKIDSIAGIHKVDYLKIGVSSEHDIKRGLDHLAFSGLNYNEISIGNGLGNISLQRYIWDNFENYSTAGLPQVVILQRKYATMSESEISGIHPQIVKEKILYRVLGISGIVNLLENGIEINFKS